jgi:hypothetical protein
MLFYYIKVSKNFDTKNQANEFDENENVSAFLRYKLFFLLALRKKGLFSLIKVNF